MTVDAERGTSTVTPDRGTPAWLDAARGAAQRHRIAAVVHLYRADRLDWQHDARQSGNWIILFRPVDEQAAL